MTLSKEPSGFSDQLDVRGAAELVGRHPETVRRWVWSGRLPARRKGNRLILRRDDVQAAAGERTTVTLAEWAARASAERTASVASAQRSAADLVTEDRELRSQPADASARR